MFSKKMEYGHIILKKLADRSYNKMLSGKEILEDTKVPYNMGLGILSELSRAGLVNSVKGKNGGFILSKEKISLLDLFCALEANKNMSVLELNKVNGGSTYDKKIQNIGKIVLSELAKTEI
ncbi:MAG: RrF2 family transcriptional regulator [Cetobacterium sp.]|uniref:RrF2 family transcriptional regulator n=1 Tax=Cetobacterium sp. TaxID=2071632 RepID=UPI003F2DCB79